MNRTEILERYEAGERDFSDANLSDANLRWANLSGTKGIIAIGPIGSRGDYVYFVRHDTCIMVKTGCFWGDLDTFLSAVTKTHGDNIHGKAYRAAVEVAKILLETKG